MEAMTLNLHIVSVASPARSWEDRADDFVGAQATPTTAAAIEDTIAVIEREITITGGQATDDQSRALAKLHNYWSQVRV